VLIATGSHPFHPANFPFHDSRVYDSDNILNLREIPATMLVAGGRRLRIRLHVRRVGLAGRRGVARATRRTRAGKSSATRTAS
jgi:hypothetical protein